MNLRNSISRLVSEEVFYKAVLIMLVGLPVVELITEILVNYTDALIPSFFQPQIISLFGILGTFLTILYLLTLPREKRKLRLADIFYFTLLFFMVISAVFSLNPGVYSGGYPFYCEHPLHFLAYYWLYFAGTLIDKKQYRKNILFAFTGVALLEGVFAFFQTYDIELSYSLYYHAERTAYGLTQNSNFYGGMCVIFVSAVSGMYIFADNIVDAKIKEYGLLAVASFLFYTLLGSRARLAWIGIVGLIIFYFISLFVMYRKAEDKAVIKAAVRRALILLGAFVAVFGIAFFFTDYISEVMVRSYWEFANGDIEKMGTDRIYNWKMGLSNVPANWLTGVGLDNYRYVFISAPDYMEGMYLQDKAHNEYIHILVTQGVPSLINYLTLLILTASRTVKNIIKENAPEKRALAWIFLGIFIAYCAQALFNSSVNYVVIYFWLVIGLMAPRNVIKVNKSSN